MKNLNYWKDQIESYKRNDFYKDYSDNLNNVENSSVNILNRSISKEMFQEISSYCQDSSIGVLIYMLGALKLTCSYFSREKEVSVSVPSIQLNEGEPCNSFLYLISPFQSDSSVSEYLNLQKNVLMNGYRHQDYDYDQLINAVSQYGKANLSVLNNLVLTYTDISRELEIQKDQNIIINLIKGEDDVLYMKIYYRDVFIKDFIDSFVTTYEVIISELFRNRDKLLGELLNEIKAKENIKNEEFISPWKEKDCLINCFQKNVLEIPESIAVKYKDCAVSYKELDEKSTLVSRLLIQEYLINKGDIVVINVGSSVELVTAMIGVMKIGAIILPMDITTPVERISFILNQVNPKLIITPYELTGVNYNSIEKLLVSDITKLQVSELPEIDPISVNDAAFILYSSGSSGTPKAIEITNKNLLNQFLWFKEYFNYHPGDVMPQKASLNFVDCLTEIFFPLTLGQSTVYLMPEGSVSKDVNALMNWLSDIGATLMLVVPSHFDFIYKNSDLTKLKTLRHIVIGGEKLDKHYDLPFTLYNLYGCTECSSISSIYKINEDNYNTIIPIGKPILNTHIKIIDENNASLPPFVKGEICIGGDGVSNGYIYDKELHDKKFLKELTWHSSSLFYRTGDIGIRLGDGNFLCLGRKDSVIKINGMKLSIPEVENILLSHPYIQEVVLVKNSGESKNQLFVFYTSNKPLSVISLRLFLLQYYPESLIPNKFIRCEYLPLTQSGKLDRQGLLQAESVRDEIDLPRNKAEETIYEILKRILKKGDFGVNDDVFELGFDSLKVVQLIKGIRDALEIQVAIQDLYLYPTVKLLAASLANSFSLDTFTDLVYLNSYDKERATIIALPPFIGVSYCYKYLGALLEGEYNVIGINLKGLFSNERYVEESLIHDTSKYVDLIIEKFRNDNIIILGYSMSVPFSFELSKQLLNKNAKVEKLFLVDDFFQTQTLEMTELEFSQLFMNEMSNTLSGILQTNIQAYFNNMELDINLLFKENSDAMGMINNFNMDSINNYYFTVKDMFKKCYKYRLSENISSDIIYFYTPKYNKGIYWDGHTYGQLIKEPILGDHGTIFDKKYIFDNSAIFKKMLTNSIIER